MLGLIQHDREADRSVQLGDVWEIRIHKDDPDIPQAFDRALQCAGHIDMQRFLEMPSGKPEA